MKKDRVYSPKEVVKEWGKIEWPKPLAFSKTVAGVIIFTGLFAGYFAICELASLWLIQL